MISFILGMVFGAMLLCVFFIAYVALRDWGKIQAQISKDLEKMKNNDLTNK